MYCDSDVSLVRIKVAGVEALYRSCCLIMSYGSHQIYSHNFHTNLDQNIVFYDAEIHIEHNHNFAKMDTFYNPLPQYFFWSIGWFGKSVSFSRLPISTSYASSSKLIPIRSFIYVIAAINL